MTLSFLTVSFLGLCDFLASQFSSYISGTPLLTHLYGMLFHFLPLTCQYSHKLHPFPSHILWVIFSISMVLNYLCFMTFKSISLWIYRFNFFFYIYIYSPPSPLLWVFVAALGLSLVVVSGDYSLVAVLGLLTVVASLDAEHGL